MECRPPGSSVHGIFQARILEWVAISSSRISSQAREQTHVSRISLLAGGFFTTVPPGKPNHTPRPWILLMTWVTILWVPLTRHCTKLLIHSTSSHADSSWLPFFSCKPLLSYQNFLMWSPFCLEIASYFFFFLNFFRMCCFIYFWLCWVFIAAQASL